MMTEFNGYHFTGDTLRDGQTVPTIGEVLVHEGPIEICSTGLHFSRTAWQAFTYATGNMLHRVMCEEIAAEHMDDKAVCRKRTIVATIDAEKLMRDFGRSCALDVIHLWDAPQVVIDFLKTGNEELRDTTWDATWDATRAAAWAAAWAAARDAARAGARDAARDAARAGARDAARAAQEKLFNAMVDAEFAKLTP